MMSVTVPFAAGLSLSDRRAAAIFSAKGGRGARLGNLGVSAIRRGYHDQEDGRLRCDRARHAALH
jgi:hypothetical protein